MTTWTVTSGEAIDAKAFWTTLGQRATGMTVVTADSDDGPIGFLGLSAAHVTANPPTMLVSVDRKTTALAGIISRRHFAVNFLPADAAAVADAFAGRVGIPAQPDLLPAIGASSKPVLPCSATRSARSTAPSTRYSSGVTSRSSSARLSRSPRGQMVTH
jgi:flavin reductase (DIM6/NTAB) family NADH-FMN oxidoreductase RutF